MGGGTNNEETDEFKEHYVIPSTFLTLPSNNVQVSFSQCRKHACLPGLYVREREEEGDVCHVFSSVLLFFFFFLYFLVQFLEFNGLFHCVW
jgi:hypothetical protein